MKVPGMRGMKSRSRRGKKSGSLQAMDGDIEAAEGEQEVRPIYCM